ncbi:MAG: hypothetical protein M0P74_01255 [Syntrophales bacterium]|jgi:hypothetical protein|nr:hypothetical protein [Syntrophales bacterium]
MEGLTGVDEGAVISQGRLLKPDDKIYDLVDAIAAAESLSGGADRRKANPEIIYDLVDVVEKRPKMAFVDAGLHDEIMKRAVDIAERIAREVIPDIAERVIRAEIEKLKKES